MSGDYSFEWQDYIKRLSTVQLEEILRTGNINGEPLHPQVRPLMEKEYEGREKPGETLYAIPLFITQETDHVYYVLARNPGEALQKAKDDDYVDIWHVTPVTPLPPSAYRWGTPIEATEGEKKQYLPKR